MCWEKNQESMEARWESIPLPKGAEQTIAAIKEQKKEYASFYDETKKEALMLLRSRDGYLSNYKHLWAGVFEKDYLDFEKRLSKWQGSWEQLIKKARNFRKMNFEHTIKTLSDATEKIAKFGADKIDRDDEHTFTHDGLHDLKADVNWSTKSLDLGKDMGIMNISSEDWDYIEAKRDILERNEDVIKQLCKLSAWDRKKYFDRLRKPLDEVYWANWMQSRAVDIKNTKEHLVKRLREAKSQKDIKHLIDIKNWWYMTIHEGLTRLLSEYELWKRKKDQALSEKNDKMNADKLLWGLGSIAS